MPALWIIRRTSGTRFPFHVKVEEDGRTLLAVRAASPWPGPGQQVFCLRDDGSDVADLLDVVEQVPILQVTRLGRKLAVVLDRPLRKRCEFLFIDKPYKDRPGSYEQVFFRTESGIRSHRSRSRLEVRPDADAPLTVIVDTAERYPWRFPAATVLRRKLAAGDYALLAADQVVATVERKSFDNLLADLGAMQALHHALAHLARQAHAALVVEAQYADFLDEKRLTGRWPPSFTARALAELQVMHPTLSVVYAGNRALANQWTHRFFQGCLARRDSAQLELAGPSSAVWERPVPLDDQVRAMILGRERFTLAEVVAAVSGAELARVRRVAQELVREGRVVSPGRGRRGEWVVVRTPG
ncbi:MAG: hypothetical protein IPK85_22500 [Gemmatimonadetes bacterium]|nr:hypothetical protein [Gemmatimonadota bacterium]